MAGDCSEQDSKNPLLSVAKAASVLKMDEKTLKGLIDWGEIRTEPGSEFISTDEIGAYLEGVCYHEAGHALVARILGGKVPIITVRWDKHGTGKAVVEPPPSENPGAQPDDESHDSEFRERCRLCLDKASQIAAAGREAQQMKTGRYPCEHAIQADLKFINEWLGFVLECEGTTAKQLLLAKSSEARKLLTQHTDALAELAVKLQETGELDGYDFTAICQQLDL